MSLVSGEGKHPVEGLPGALAAIWERFLLAPTTLGPTPGAREAWHKGRARYAVWVLRVNDPHIAERAARIAASLGAMASPVPHTQHHITVWVSGFPLPMNAERKADSSLRVSPLPPAGQETPGEMLDDDVDQAVLDEQARAVNEASLSPFDLLLGGVNSFLTAPFLHVTDPSDGIARLRTQLGLPLQRRCLRELRFAPFVPHLTVAHFAAGVATKDIAPKLEPFRQLPDLHCRVNALELVDFCAHTAHAPFNVLRRISLGTGARPILRGDVYWLAADPAQGSLPGHAHPHLVLQDDVFNRSRVDTVVVCALTTNLGRANEPGNVLLEPGEGDLPKQSVLVVSQVSSVKKSQLGAFIGTLSAARVEQVMDGLRFQQRAFFGDR